MGIYTPLPLEKLIIFLWNPTEFGLGTEVNFAETVKQQK